MLCSYTSNFPYSNKPDDSGEGRGREGSVSVSVRVRVRVREEGVSVGGKMMDVVGITF